MPDTISRAADDPVGVIDAPARAVTAMLVSHHPLFRLGLRTALRAHDAEVVAEEDSHSLALARAPVVRPDLIVIDADLRGDDALGLARELAPRLPGTRIILVSGEGNDAEVLQAVRAGVTGYLTKSMEPDALARAIIGSLDGDLTMPRRYAARLVRRLVELQGELRPGRRSALGLTARESDIVERVAAGRSDREIAVELGRSPRTVARHVGSILAKLGARDRLEAAAIWRRDLVRQGRAAAGGTP